MRRRCELQSSVSLRLVKSSPREAARPFCLPTTPPRETMRPLCRAKRSVRWPPGFLERPAAPVRQGIRARREAAPDPVRAPEESGQAWALEFQSVFALRPPPEQASEVLHLDRQQRLWQRLSRPQSPPRARSAFELPPELELGRRPETGQIREMRKFRKLRPDPDPVPAAVQHRRARAVRGTAAQEELWVQPPLSRQQPPPRPPETPLAAPLLKARAAWSGLRWGPALGARNQYERQLP
jgi:hypothetical protein